MVSAGASDSDSQGISYLESPALMGQRFSIHRHVKLGTILVALAVAAALSGIAYTFLSSSNANWPVFRHYLFNDGILTGVYVTIELTILAQLAALVLGFISAYAGQSGNPVARAVSFIYIFVFRGTPVLVQLLLWFNIALFVPHLSLGIPFTGWSRTWDTNALISSFTAALLGLSLHEGAYMSEVFRAGFASVPPGQTEAALSLGLRRGQVLRRILLPQSMRVIIPPTGNQFVNLLKTTALVSVIGGGDVLTRAQYIYGQNLQVIPLLFVATFWYLVIISVAQFGQYYLERRFGSRSLFVGSRPAARSIRLLRSNRSNAGVESM